MTEWEQAQSNWSAASRSFDKAESELVAVKASAQVAVDRAASHTCVPIPGVGLIVAMLLLLCFGCASDRASERAGQRACPNGQCQKQQVQKFDAETQKKMRFD